MNELKLYNITRCDGWCRKVGLPEYSKLLKLLKVAVNQYEDVMHSEFDGPNEKWSLDEDFDKELIEAKKLIEKLS